MMKDEGYGKGYLYDHDAADGFSGQNYFPDGIERESFYTPVERGFEREMKKRLDYFNSLRAKKCLPCAPKPILLPSEGGRKAENYSVSSGCLDYRL